MKADFVKNIRMKLENFSKFLGSKPWFVGDTVSIRSVEFSTSNLK